jgi:hypothetical protein
MAPDIRLATSVDAAAVLEIYGPFCDDSPVTFETKRPTITEMEARILDIIKGFPWLVGIEAGAWHDVSWWDLTLQPAGLEPGETYRIGEVAHRGDFVAAINGARALLR